MKTNYSQQTRTALGIMALISVVAMTNCSKEKVRGCTNPSATNYNSKADEDDGSCKISGCTDPTATNFNASANVDNGSCTYPCEVNQTAKVYFKNFSVTNRTYDVIWDGAHVATVAPNQQSQIFTVTANVQHTFLFNFTNTGNAACTQANPIIPQCTTHEYSCSQ